METNLNNHRNGVAPESVELQQFQGDINKINTSVLRGIDGSTLQFITFSRNTDPEYIDHTLLSPDYISAHIQSGLVVDIIQTQPYDGNESMPQNMSPLEMTTERQVISNHQNAPIGINAMHQTIQSPQNQIEAHLQHRSSIDLQSNQIIEVNRKVIADQNRQYVQFVPKSTVPMLPNEAPVIVSNKEAASMNAVNEIDLSFPDSFNHIDQSVLQDIAKASEASNQQHQQQIDGKTLQNDLPLPPLPPLTPISKIELIRKSVPIDQSTIRSCDPTPKNDEPLKNVCYLSDENDVNIFHSNAKYMRQLSKEPTNAPKKNLPHKKRITKKLKSISPTDDQIRMDILDHSKYSLDLVDQYGLNEIQSQLETHQPASTPNQHQDITLHLTSNSQQPIQLTTTRHHKEPITSQYLSSNQFSEHNGIQLPVQPMNPVQPTHFSCELCGMSAESQLSFYHHLKLHYEPNASSTPPNNIKMESGPRNLTSIANEGVESSMILEQNNQGIYRINAERKMNENGCLPNQSLSVVDGVYDQNIQSSAQDFSCISGIGAEDTNDGCDDSINEYADTGLNCIKNEQNEFSDPEDMLESGVLDKVQRVVDSYIIENASSDVKNLISLAESPHHTDLVNNTCNWSTPNQNALTNSMVYSIDKANTADNSTDHANNFTISTLDEQHQNQLDLNPNQSQSIRSINERPEELTLIYELNMNEKNFHIIENNSEEGVLQRQLLNSENGGSQSSPANQNQYVEGDDAKVVNLSSDRGRSSSSVIMKSTMGKVNVQDEFIEEEQTDSDIDSTKPDSLKKKKKIFRCKRCNKLCNSKNALHYHFLSHTGERPFVCDICGKAFFASSALKVHNRLHSGDKPYECKFCMRPFRQFGDMKYHIQSKHTKEKSHQCEFCGKDFSRRYSLVIHRRIHTGEKNYKCEFCEKEFRASSYLQVHRKIHTGEKPFVCNFKDCGKKFRVRGDLKRHANIHERNKVKEPSLDEISSSSNSAKGELFALDDSSTLQSRSADTLDQLVSVIESNDAAFSSTNNSDSFKKRNFSLVSNTSSSPDRLKEKRAPNDCSAVIINYSNDHLMNK